ncbi:MAG: PIG-L family deacetylase [Pseudomonadota bacterium]
MTPQPALAATGAVVIAPHCDDAAFSLGGAIAAGALGPFAVINLFSRTSFTLQGLGPVEEVSRHRKAEEAAALADRARRIAFLDYDDWCLGTRGQAGLPAQAGAQAFEAIASLATGMGTRTLLFPLGIGAHPDHLAAHHLAGQFSDGWRVGFYEDLPYAALAGAQPEAHLGRLAPQVIAGDVHGKRALLSCYRTQVAPPVLEAVSQYHRQTGGERIFWRTTGPA